MIWELKDPQNSPWWTMALEWLLENKPADAKAMFLSKTLLAYLDRKTAVASDREDRLLKQGVAQDVAEEMVTAIIAPSDGPALMNPEPPERLPESLERKIQAWAENLPHRKVIITL